MALLYSIHDRDGHPLIPAGGWCVDAVLVTDTPPDYARIRGDINWIVRLNHGWHPNGTIPLRPDYPAYAKRCADFAARCHGVKLFIVSNEPNHRQEQPHGTPIQPQDYADCFNLCYQAITYERPDAEVLTAAVAPWDNTSGIDWLSYYRQMLERIIECDGLALHGYTHGADPNLIWSMEKQHNWYWHFPVIYQTIQAIPSKFATRLLHVTETDQGDDAWLDANTGWVQNAYESINLHNDSPGTQKIQSLALYRWRGDKYELHNKNGVQDDLRDAVRRQYQSPSESPTPPQPEPPQPTPPTPIPDPEPPRDIDPRLIARGVTITRATVPVGAYAWRVEEGIYYAWGEGPNDAQGRRADYVDVVNGNGERVIGTLIMHWWSSGSDTKPAENKRDPWMTAQGKDGYALDFPFGATWPSYGVRVADGTPSDEVWGLGYGDAVNPNHHTASYFKFVRVKEGEGPGPTPEPPEPPVKHDLVHPLVGAVITQNFYEESDAYLKYGFSAHNGCDMGGRPLRTPVRSMASGIVAMSDFDSGYGHYVRMDYRDLDCYVMYCHLDEPGASTGTRLQAGDTVGLLGSSGNSSGPHCHIEVRLQNKDGTYREDTPMSKGRVDPRTWAAMHNLKL